MQIHKDKKRKTIHRKVFTGCCVVVRIFLIMRKKGQTDTAEGENVGFGFCLIIGDDLDKII